MHKQTMPVPIYLEELKRVFSDTPYRRKKAEKHLRKSYTEGSYGFMWNSARGSSSHIFSVFGGFKDTWNTYLRDIPQYRRDKHCRCGIEILGLRPYEKGSTYSSVCSYTIPQLKEACKKNGIKVKSSWKKIDMLSALLKV